MTGQPQPAAVAGVISPRSYGSRPAENAARLLSSPNV